MQYFSDDAGAGGTIPTVALGGGNGSAGVGGVTDVAGVADAVDGAGGVGGGWGLSQPTMIRKAAATLWTRNACLMSHPQSQFETTRKSNPLLADLIGKIIGRRSS